MKLRYALALLVFAIMLPASPFAQNATAPAQPTSTRLMPKPAREQAAGADPHKVLVNTTSNVYHCPGDRYYGKTKEGKYMTEPQAKAAGAHGVKGQTCFK